MISTTPESLDSKAFREPATYANPSAECDLVMKGGITSGIVYPLAVCRLAARYQLRNLGGASAGAIAAAITAAAEYARQGAPGAPDGTADRGFARLATLPDTLGTSLASLFVPSPPLRRRYAALLPLISGGSLLARLSRCLLRVLRVEVLTFLLVLSVFLAPATWLLTHSDGASLGRFVGFGVACLAGLMLATIAAAGIFANRTLKALPSNGFGFVNGLNGDSAQPALTDWLCAELDATAGLTTGPLTFGHLYGPAASTAFVDLKLDEEGAAQSPVTRHTFQPVIDLQMMTTCLTLGRPYAFPFSTKVFHYCPECWTDYFPPYVLDHLLRTSTEARPKKQRVGDTDIPIDRHCPTHPAVVVRRLPAAPDLPVVVGVRMSLAFPVLLSAVPMYAVDFTRLAGKQELVRVWFADGGMSSNFPIHFFDSLLPHRPTFGITLGKLHPDSEARTWRARDNRSGILARPKPIGSVGAFLGACVRTMQNWQDQMAASAPGFRDRIVEVRLADDEGGMNLDMPPEVIARLADYGDRAAVDLDDFDWDNHRWVRYRTAMGMMSQTLFELGEMYPAYADFAAGHTGGSYALGAKARAADAAAAGELAATARSWADAAYPATTGPLPRPRPALRPRMPQ